MKGIYYAHRGLHNKKAGIPENSLAAFQAAVDAGYGIELDLQLTKDGEVVVFHDFSLKRVCHVSGDVSDYTYQELQKIPLDGTDQRIPRFRDVLKIVDGKVPLLVELKYKNVKSRICPKADELLRRYKGPYVIESFNPYALLWFRLRRPEICRGQLAMNFWKQEKTMTPVHILSQNLLFNFVSRPDFIAYDVRNRREPSLWICRRIFGAPCAAWTVKSQKQLKDARLWFDAYIFEGFRP